MYHQYFGVPISMTDCAGSGALPTGRLHQITLNSQTWKIRRENVTFLRLVLHGWHASDGFPRNGIGCAMILCQAACYGSVLFLWIVELVLITGTELAYISRPVFMNSWYPDLHGWVQIQPNDRWTSAPMFGDSWRRSIFNSEMEQSIRFMSLHNGDIYLWYDLTNDRGPAGIILQSGIEMYTWLRIVDIWT